jgi:hypothetical protein
VDALEPVSADALTLALDQAMLAVKQCDAALQAGGPLEAHWLTALAAYEQTRTQAAASAGTDASATVDALLEALNGLSDGLEAATRVAEVEPSEQAAIRALRQRAARAVEEKDQEELRLMSRLTMVVDAAVNGDVTPASAFLQSTPDLAPALAFLMTGGARLGSGIRDADASAAQKGPATVGSTAVTGGNRSAVGPSAETTTDTTPSASTQESITAAAALAPGSETDSESSVAAPDSLSPSDNEASIESAATASGTEPPTPAPDTLSSPETESAGPASDTEPPALASGTEPPAAAPHPLRPLNSRALAPAAAAASPVAACHTESPAEPPAPTKNERLEAAPETEPTPPAPEVESPAPASDSESPLPAPETEAPAPSPDTEHAAGREEGSNDRDVEAVLASLLVQGRDGLAWRYSVAADQEDYRSFALRALALSGTVATGSELAAQDCALALEEIATISAEPDHATRLIAVAAAIPVAAAAPHLGGAQVLSQHKLALREDEAIETFVSALQAVAEQGVSVRHMIAGTAVSLANAEAHEDELAAEAADLLDHPTRVKYQRASQVMRDLMKPEAPVGRILTAVRDRDSSAVGEVRTLVEEHRRRGAIDHLIDEAAGRLRTTRRKKIDGDARNRLVNALDDILALGGRWSQLREAMQAPQGGQDWLQAQAATLREAARPLESLEIPTVEDEQDLVEAAKVRVRRAVALVLDMLNGSISETDGRPTNLILSAELLRDPELRIGRALDPPHDLELAQLEPLLEPPDWRDAALGRAGRGDDELAQWALDLLPDEQRDEIQEEVDALARDAKLSCAHREGIVVSDLASKSQRGALSTEDWEALARDVDRLANEAGLMTGEKVDRLLALARRIEDAAERHVAATAQGLTPRAVKSGPHVAEMVANALADQDVATAERLLLEAERGEPLEPVSQSTPLFELAFPLVANKLSELGLSPGAIAEALRLDSLPFELPSEAQTADQVERAALALEALPSIYTRDQVARRGIGAVLEVLGLSVEHLGVGSVTGKWQTYDAQARITDKALVPHFGSQASGRYRIVVIPRDSATEGGISSWLQENEADRPTIALHDGILSPLVRRRLADRARRASTSRQALIADLATVTTVAAVAPSSFECFARLTLPFTGINPYNPYAAGVVPEEMFYGREEALADLLDVDGRYAFIYGGRRLGKSALLRAADRRAQSRPSLEARYIDLNDEGVGEYQPASHALALIERQLDSILPPTKKQLPEGRLADRLEQLMAAGKGPRILVLLDEADGLIDADAADDFRVLKALRRMRDESGRIRFVFAGLHSVRRFDDVVNQRLIHFGPSLKVGGLSPTEARKLIERPLHSLGYRLPDDAVNRILTVTQLQPSLVQLVCDELLKYLTSRSVEPTAPPHQVDRADVERVLALPGLAREIADRFELTIRLDERYRFIALIVASLADDHMDALFEAGEIREQCEVRWPAGFADTTATEFGALLDEMVGLSVLYERDGEYGLFSPHVGRMLGTTQQIDSKLRDAAGLPAPKRTFDGTAFRPALAVKGIARGYRLSPLNLFQINDLQNRQSGLRVIVGTKAHASRDVKDALRELVAEPEQRLEVMAAEGPLSDPDEAKWFVGRVKADSRTNDRVTFGVAGDIDPDSLRDLFEGTADALDRRQSKRSSVGVILVDERALPAWVTLLADGIEENVGARLLRLRRHSIDSLRVWSSRASDLTWFETDETAGRVVEATGGWPTLVTSLVDTLRRRRDLDAALAQLETNLQDGSGAQLLLDVGLGDDRLLRSFRLLCELHAGLPPHEAADLLADGCDLEGPEAEAVWRVLRAVGAVDVDGESGTVRPEPLLHRFVLQTD